MARIKVAYQHLPAYCHYWNEQNTPEERRSTARVGWRYRRQYDPADAGSYHDRLVWTTREQIEEALARGGEPR